MACLPWGGSGDEELGAIGVLSCIGHAKKALLGVLQLEVLIWELIAVDFDELVEMGKNWNSAHILDFPPVPSPLVKSPP